MARSGVHQEEIEEAGKATHIHEFIAGLPKGDETLIGEQGIGLAGRARQRSAIARAYLKDGPILIFDEPTANLDPVTGKQVLDSLLGTMKGKTTLLIPHGLIGLENVDQVLVMDKGRIAEVALSENY